MKLISFLLILVLILSMFLLPSATPVLGIILVTLSLSLAFATIFRKHRLAYQAGRLTGKRFASNVFLEIVGTLLAVTLAVLLSSYVVGIVVRLVSNRLWQLTAMVLLGMLVGIGVGFLVNRAWGRLVKIVPGS